MTLLMAALVLSASGCFNDEMSSSEGTVKGFLKAMNHRKPIKKMQSYWDPARVPDKNTIVRWYENCYYKLLDEELGLGGKVPEGIREGLLSVMTRVSSPWLFEALSTSNVKTTLVSDRLGKVWKGDKWHPQKQATVEVSYKRTIPTDKAIMSDNCQDIVKLVKSDNKWYIERWSGF